MKPVQFDLKINPEALVTRAEEHLHFLRERTTYFENAKVEGVPVCSIRNIPDCSR